MSFGSTQPVKEISTRNVYLGGKSGRCLGMKTLSPQLPGTFRACRSTKRVQKVKIQRS